MSAAAENGRLLLVASRVVLLAVLVTLVLVSVTPAFEATHWHGPDAHSTRPHRGADSPLSAGDLASRVLSPALSASADDQPTPEPLPLANRLASDSAFHPPQ